MNVRMPYETLRERHPEVVTQMVAKIRKGKSKAKDTDPATWKWTYEWGTWGRSYNLGEILNGKTYEDRGIWSAMSPVERAEDEMSRSKPVWLSCSPPRTWAVGELPADYMPSEIQDIIWARWVPSEPKPA